MGAGRPHFSIWGGGEEKGEQRQRGERHSGEKGGQRRRQRQIETEIRRPANSQTGLGQWGARCDHSLSLTPGHLGCPPARQAPPRVGEQSAPYQAPPPTVPAFQAALKEAERRVGQLGCQGAPATRGRTARCFPLCFCRWKHYSPAKTWKTQLDVRYPVLSASPPSLLSFLSFSFKNKPTPRTADVARVLPPPGLPGGRERGPQKSEQPPGGQRCAPTLGPPHPLAPLPPLEPGSPKCWGGLGSQPAVPRGTRFY